MRRMMVLVAGLVVSMAVTVGCTSGTTAGTQTGAPDGETVMNEKCARCHSLDRVQAARKSAEDWKVTVSRMQGNGLRLSDAEKAAVIDYLATTYGQ